MSRRWIGYAAAWLIAAVVAVSVGVLAVTSVGASVRDRGPLGNEVLREETQTQEGSASPRPGATRVQRTIEDDFGSFEVECRGAIAYGLSTTTNPGWRTVSYEPGPDDDVDAVFSSGNDSIEIEVFCNQGRPTVSDLERKTLSDDD